MAIRKDVKYVPDEDAVSENLKVWAKERRELTLIRDVLALRLEIFQLQQLLNGTFNPEEQNGDQIQHGKTPTVTS